METYCSYCNQLHKAIKDQNFCSKQGDTISSVSSNAYYFKSNKLHSGEHVSRLSIRTISDGYQRHKIKDKDYVLDKNQYLIINEGEEFNSQITTNNPVEGLLVAFRKSDICKLSDSINRTEMSLLDDPFETKEKDVVLETQTLALSWQMKMLFDSLKSDIKSEYHSSLYYEELFYLMLYQVFDDHIQIDKKIKKFNFKKAITKKETFVRLRKVREYIDANIQKDLNLDYLSRIATMSPFHFLRNFKEYYSISPHKYLVKKRIQKAKFLLRDSNMDVETIVNSVGFQNKSSFGRLFKSKENLSPIAYRQKHNLNTTSFIFQ